MVCTGHDSNEWAYSLATRLGFVSRKDTALVDDRKALGHPAVPA